ncbi:DUF1823 domain-containing protein [Pycnococcus provasolii]
MMHSAVMSSSSPSRLSPSRRTRALVVVGQRKTHLRRASTSKAAAATPPPTSTAATFDPSKPIVVDDALLTNEAMLAIVNLEVSDAHVNELAWSCLGYARNGYDLDTDDLTVKEMWDTAQVFPNWLKRFPEPPDFLGVKRDYRPEIDAPVKAACSALVRSIPAEHKQGLKQQLKELGWTGFTLDGLTPNKTRRAQVANWLIFFREELNGVPLEELIRRKQQRAEEEEKEQVERPTGTAKQGVV